MRSCGLLPGTRFELFRLLCGPAPTHLLRARVCSTERQSASANATPARRRLALNPKTEAGPGKSCISVAALVDTNVLVYRFDGRFPKKAGFYDGASARVLDLLRGRDVQR